MITALKMALLCGGTLLVLAGPTFAQAAARPAPMSTAAAADLIPQAVIRRDTFGVPHITADTDEAAAFAMGYAVAEDHAVEMGKLYLQARGDAARWFGPEYLDDDFAMRRMDNLEGARRALERTGDGYRRWLHGEAVAMGLVMAADLSRRLGMLDEVEVGRIKRLLQRAGLPSHPTPDMQSEALLAAMQIDKKVQGGKLRVVVMRGIGAAELLTSPAVGLLRETISAAIAGSI